MKPIDRIQNIFNEYGKYELDPIDFLDKARSILEEACNPGEDYDPRELNKAKDACNAYGGVSNLFLANGYLAASQSLLFSAWDLFGRIQREDNQRIYRAGLGYYLSKLYLSHGDNGAAIRWALLTQADDILGGHSKGGGAGKQALVTIFGIASEELKLFNKIAKNNLTIVENNSSKDWSRPEAYAENILIKFALQAPESSHLFAQDSLLQEYPLSLPYYNSLLSLVDVDHASSKEKGEILEDLATYLFMLIPAWSPRRNLLDEFNTFETDIVVRNLKRTSDPTVEILGRHILVECKNWDMKIGVQEVGYFLYRMRLTHVRFGVIFSKLGVTGTVENEKSARSIIRKSFHEDGSICVVLDLSDLKEFQNKHSSFWSLLLERIERIRFGKSK